MPATQLFHPSSATDPKTVCYWSNLPGSSTALAFQQLQQQINAPVVIITADTPQALRLEQELAFFSDKQQIQLFPDWEILPYDNFSPHQDIISQRLLTLHQLQQGQLDILIVPITTLMARLAPQTFLSGQTFILKQGDQLNLEQTRLNLEKNGYYCVSQVMEHGEFAIRGSLLDIFPMGSKTPFRIDLFDDEVDSIRTFDPETQLSADTIDAINLLPAKEFPFNEQAIQRFRQNWREHFNSAIEPNSLYHEVSQGQLPAGIEFYLPLFFEHTQLLFDYLPKQCHLIYFDSILQKGEQYWEEISKRHQQRIYDNYRPPLSPHTLFANIADIFQCIKQYPRIEVCQQTQRDKAYIWQFNCQPLPDVSVNHKQKQPFSKLIELHSQHKGQIIICADSMGRREVLADLLKEAKLRYQISDNWQQCQTHSKDLLLTVAQLETGFACDDPKLMIIGESDLFGEQVRQSRRRDATKPLDQGAILKSLAELKIGDAVVHFEHGIGRYQGLEVLEVNQQATEFLLLEYAEQSKLYVPVASLHLISRYTGADSDRVAVHKLGTDKWEKQKRKAAEKVHDVAAELLDIYAKRASRKGQAFQIDQTLYRQFSAEFPFEETPDQQQAILQVMHDLQQAKPMDRLVCGDVGFGKTEVAMRAAFIASQAGQQVAILTPTTLLSQQHFQSFSERFAQWPVKIGVLSRFNSKKEEDATLQGLAEGTVDIVIGTHKLLQDRIRFKRLGLLIIDEEHRFGVRQKEKFKQLRSEIDILTLTATPIPRTLNMSLTGMRDLSIIATPPAKRLSIKTFIRESDNATIREAILREVLRGGQVYFLHNEVESIERRMQELVELVPEARFAVGHGQMAETQLERVMSNFYHQRFNVLVCTTIIETGIDVPTANTIIIERADKFGVAQLHQLRGRVGRSHHQAYAYLLTRNYKSLTKDAQKRLEAISSMETLGAGFALATQDLEIRGAGELLGDEQSGQIQAVGFSMYMEMLEQAVQALSEGKEPSLNQLLAKQCDVVLNLPALLPDNYIGDVNLRLSLYKRIANCNNSEQITALKSELVDRFGLLPAATENLLKITQIKLRADKLGISKVEGNVQAIGLEFLPNTRVEPIKVIQLIQQQPQRYQLQGADKLKLKVASDASNRLTMVNDLLDLLES